MASPVANSYGGRPDSLQAVVAYGEAHGNVDAFLREFLDAFYSEPDVQQRAAMLASEPPLRTHPPTLNAYLAAVAEHLAFRYCLPVPAWTQAPERFLKHPFFPAGLESLKAICLVESPVAFRRRMIFVDADPLYRPRRTDSAVTLLQNDDAFHSLRKIDVRAKAANVIVDLSVYNGIFLAQTFDLHQATREVDAVVQGSSSFLQKVVAGIAEEEGWSDQWLSDSIKGFISANQQIQLMQSFSNVIQGGLRVYMPTPEYLFAMKCMMMRREGAERAEDIADIEALAGRISDTATALTLVDAFYPAGNIPTRVHRVAERIMGIIDSWDA